MSIKRVQKQPIEGQFVAMWIYGNFLWSGTFVWNSGKLYELVGGDNEEIRTELPEGCEIFYYILEDN